MRKTLIAPAITLGLMALAVPSAAQAESKASSTIKAKNCVVSDRADVTFDRKANTATVKDDTVTGGNYFGCYINTEVEVGDLVTFDFTGVTCETRGGVPRVYLGGIGENTHDSNNVCVPNATGDGGTVTYTIQNSGTITSFALIYDRGDGGTVTYSDLRINGLVVDF